MNTNQPRTRVELGSSCPFPTTIAITPQATPRGFCFFVLKAYQPLWVVLYQSHPFRRIVAVLFNPKNGDKKAHAFPKDISSKVNTIT